MVRGWILVLDDSCGRVDGKALRVCNYIRARKHRNDVYPGTVYEFIRWAIIIGAQRTYHQHAVPVSAAYFVCTFTPRYIWQTQISYYWTNTQGPIAIPADWVELGNGSLSTVELRWSIPLGKHDVPCSITQHCGLFEAHIRHYMLSAMWMELRESYIWPVIVYTFFRKLYVAWSQYCLIEALYLSHVRRFGVRS